MKTSQRNIQHGVVNNAPRTRNPAWRQWAGTSLIATWLASTVGCNSPEPFQDGPDLYGVTLPLPPPSLSGRSYALIGVEGSLPSSYNGDSVRVSLWVSGDPEVERGYFVPNDGQTFSFVDVEVALKGTCLTTWYESEFDDGLSATRSYQVFVQSNVGECRPENRCSQPDESGACICMAEASEGCS